MPIVEVARRHGIHPNQLHGWRRQARLGLGTQECRLVPIAVAPAESKVCEQPKAAVGDAPPIIELVLRNGRVLRVLANLQRADLRGPSPQFAEHDAGIARLGNFAGAIGDVMRTGLQLQRCQAGVPDPGPATEQYYHQFIVEIAAGV